MRRHLDGTAHLLACGCPACCEALEFRFNDLVYGAFSAAEETAIDLAAEQVIDAQIGEGSLSASLRERIAAYSGPLPDVTA